MMCFKERGLRNMPQLKDFRKRALKDELQKTCFKNVLQKWYFRRHALRDVLQETCFRTRATCYVIRVKGCHMLPLVRDLHTSLFSCRCGSPSTLSAERSGLATPAPRTENASFVVGPCKGKELLSELCVYTRALCNSSRPSSDLEQFLVS